MSALGRVLVCLAWLLACLSPLGAQSADLPISIGSVVEGSLAAGESQRYIFSALELTLLSVRVEALDETLDPQVELFDVSGQRLTVNDDYAYPTSRDAAIQAFLLTKTGTYSLAVSAVGESSGAYRLHLLPGYDRLALRDTELNRADWQIVHSETPVNLSDSSLFAVDLQGYGRSAILLGTHFPKALDAYFEASFSLVASPVNWQVGLVFRYQSPDQYHRLLLSKTGYWRVDRIAGSRQTTLRDWSTHPIISAGESAFRLGILFSGGHYDVLYNGQVVGSAAESDWQENAAAGGVGIAMRTDNIGGALMSFALDGALMTEPTRVAEKVIFPQRILARRAYLMGENLARQQLTPATGEINFTLSESSVRHIKAGVTRLPIVSDLAFAQFALGATVTKTVGGAANGGCGLYFHYENEVNYTLAYLTRAGEYGLSRRTGDIFAPGLYGQRSGPTADRQSLLLIVSDALIHFYLDETYAGSMENEPRIGSLGIAVVNYEEADTVCQFDDLWLLSFDE